MVVRSLPMRGRRPRCDARPDSAASDHSERTSSSGARASSRGSSGSGGVGGLAGVWALRKGSSEARGRGGSTRGAASGLTTSSHVGPSV